MDIKKLKEELIVDEGLVGEIYKCSEGFLTFGVGEKVQKFGINHLVSPNDPEYGMEEGTPVSFNRIQEAFDEDIKECLVDAEYFYIDLYTYPEEVQRIIANMCFNLGRDKYSKFRKMIAAIENRDWKKAAKEMKNSLWYHQVKSRGKRLVGRMNKVTETYYVNPNQHSLG